jgi:hypothetical protein
MLSRLDEPDELQSFEMGMCGYLKREGMCGYGEPCPRTLDNGRVGTAIVSKGFGVWERSSCPHSAVGGRKVVDNTKQAFFFSWQISNAALLTGMARGANRRQVK